MMLTRALAIFVIAGCVATGFHTAPVVAQIGEVQPAEFPPSSYNGKQYVDSKGCVFIRAGIDGNVSWVPRVGRDRTPVCGFKPTGLTPGVASAPAPNSAPPPVQITLDNVTPAATPAPAPAPVARPAPRRTAAAPAPAKRRAAPVVVRQTAPEPRVAAPAPVVIAPAPQPRVIVSGGATACPGASPLSQQYLRGKGVRCGPQAEPVLSRSAAGNVVVVEQGAAPAPAPIAVTPTTRIVPKHVALNRINTRNVQVPHGYKEVWTDDRLNPYRAEQNLQGRADMLLIWTQTLPRRLIDQSTGRDVTASVPLVYPYLSVAEQQRELGEVTIVQRNGQLTKRIVRHNRASAAREPVYSSRSTPAAAAPKAVAPAQARTAALAGKRFVQVGTFREPGNAQRAAQTIAGMGLPARIGKHTKNGRSYMTVQAGPFAGPNDLQTAINRLRSAGYRDAFAR